MQALCFLLMCTTGLVEIVNIAGLHKACAGYELYRGLVLLMNMNLAGLVCFVLDCFILGLVQPCIMNTLNRKCAHAYKNIRHM